MEVRDYLQILFRWWWVFSIAIIITGGYGYISTTSQDPTYVATTRVFIGGYSQNPDPGSGEITTSAALAQTYANLILMRPILSSTIDSLNLNTDPNGLRGQITADITENTSILNISVTNGSPVLAANIANELAAQLIATSPTSLSPEDINRRDFIEEEIENASTQLITIREAIDEIDQYLLDNPDAEDYEEQVNRRDTLINQETQLQSLLSTFLTSYTNLRTSTNTLSIVEPAQVPENPTSTNPLRNALITSLVGAILAGGFVLAYEYFDDTLRTIEDVRRISNLTVLAGVPQFGKKNDPYKDRLIVLEAPNSSPVQSYRSLRTNILFGNQEEAPSRLIVTSARAGEGKTVTAANMAAAFAEYQLMTVLIDADFYRPNAHRFFEMDNRAGLSSLFKQPVPESGLYTWEQLSSIVQDTTSPNFKIITTGPRPSNPSEVLGMKHLAVLCDSLEAIGVDMIIFDSPPATAVVDSLSISSQTGAFPIIVVEANKTHRTQVQRVLAQFDQVENTPMGIVLNNITNRGSFYQYYYYSYDQYISR